MKKSKEFIQLCKEYGVDSKLVPEILSFEAACAVTGDDPGVLPIVDNLPALHRKRLIADYKLSIIADALRNKIPPNYNDDDEYKYFPYFEIHANEENKSGFGLSYDDCGDWDTVSLVGVRHCFPNSDIARFYGKHFIALHKDHQLYT